jgi:hypothetical protein
MTKSAFSDAVSGRDYRQQIYDTRLVHSQLSGGCLELAPPPRKCYISANIR